MTKSKIYWLTGLMSVSLAGIIWLQVIQITKAMRLSEANFEVGVREALHRVADQLEQIEMNRALFLFGEELHFVSGDSVQSQEQAHLTITRQRVSGAWIQDADTDSSVIVGATSTVTEQVFVSDEGEKQIVVVKSGQTGGQEEAIRINIDEGNRMVEVISRSLHELGGTLRPLSERINYAQLDSLIGLTLADQGLSMDYRFMVSSVPASDRILISPDTDSEYFQKASYRIRLYPLFESEKATALMLRFPNRMLHTLRSIWTQAIGSILFSGIIILCFVIAIRTIFRQKKLSEMKNDFINNMTHELKTPLATISVATDALRSEKVQQDPKEQERYTRIIKEENRRMNRQVERVLQAARFDKGENEMHQVEMDVHDCLREAADQQRVQVESREGRLELDFCAWETTAAIDPVHFRQAIGNLLDNANKYSESAPQITLSTRNEDDALLIEVSDRGRGISKADQLRIFDRFYRVPTGNIHDVKGFGLGLSYVRDILTAHGGSIRVTSSPGQGSIFTVTLPLSNKQL